MNDLQHIPMSEIKSLRIINGKVPAIELELKTDEKSFFFAMMSD